jgi:hypothetical protein
MAAKEYNSMEYNNRNEHKMTINNNDIGNNIHRESKYQDPTFQMPVPLAKEESTDPFTPATKTGEEIATPTLTDE